MNRRHFLKGATASLALSALGSFKPHDGPCAERPAHRRWDQPRHSRIHGEAGQRAACPDVFCLLPGAEEC